MRTETQTSALRMLAWLCAMIAALLLLGCGGEKKETAAPAGYTVTDAAGNTVAIAKRPMRIVADSQSLDTMLLAVVEPSRLAAVSLSTKDPAISYVAGEVKDIEKTIPLAAGISAEDLATMEPDLIVCSNYSRPKDLDLYRSLGFPVVVVKGPTTIAEVEAAVTLIAAAADEKERGGKVVAEMERRFAHIEDVLSGVTAPRPTALLISQMQSYGGPGSMYHELLTRAHIENAMAKMGVKNGQLMSLEAMVESDPDFFFVSTDRSSDETGAGQFRDSRLANPALQSLRAYEHIIPLDDRYIYASTQNCVYAVEAMANAAYGPLFDLSEEKNIRGY